MWVQFSLVPAHAHKHYDCTHVISEFNKYIGTAVIDNGYNKTKQFTQDQNMAERIILTYPVCFPQSLIDAAQANYKP